MLNPISWLEYQIKELERQKQALVLFIDKEIEEKREKIERLKSEQ